MASIDNNAVHRQCWSGRSRTTNFSLQFLHRRRKTGRTTATSDDLLHSSCTAPEPRGAAEELKALPGTPRPSVMFRADRPSHCLSVPLTPPPCTTIIIAVACIPSYITPLPAMSGNAASPRSRSPLAIAPLASLKLPGNAIGCHDYPSSDPANLYHQPRSHWSSRRKPS